MRLIYDATNAMSHLRRGTSEEAEKVVSRTDTHLPVTITGGHHQPLRRAAAHRQGRRLSGRAGGNILSTLCPVALAWPCGSMGCSAALAPDLILSVAEFLFFECRPRWHTRRAAEGVRWLPLPPICRLAIAVLTRCAVRPAHFVVHRRAQERVAAPRCSAARRSSSSCRRNQLAQRPPCTAD